MIKDKKNFNSDCTAILVGKNASMDGSTMIARDEDGHDGVKPKLFVTYPAKDHNGETFISTYNGVKVPLTEKACRYTATPNADQSEGIWDEQGINEYNVGMSATETEFTNPRVLGYDPLVEDGIDEDSMVTLVLPYIKTAREGVIRLGGLIEKYGTGETNGIAFNDKDEIWYLETGGGHQWVAQRIPDDAYAVAPNIMCIEEIDFNNSDFFMTSSNIQAFVETNHLNPNPQTFNFRNIFGTKDEADAYYNTPRSWYGQKLFTPDLEQAPTSQDIPFIQRANRKIAVEDVEFFLSSHYNGTPYDPFDTYASGTKDEQKKFRSIALDRNHCACILQIRNHVAEQLAAVQWINLGFYCYSPFVPFYTNVTDTPKNYQVADAKVSLNSAYWLYKALQVVVEPHYHQFISQVNDYRDTSQSYVLGRLKKIDTDAAQLSADKITSYLTKANDDTAGNITNKTEVLLSDLFKQSLLSSKYFFDRGQNL
ncbi:C69 family dipeptidase [Loigolactobacillus iwatensis]|uniref:C69 family dipeptidase n=1 Tax=Loigolactobacillus iwatensis TaxID=1267156 RepID=UPI000F7F8625|nr:C69 family dipeptidase [Loigolactobacillus iwatensis]